MDTPDTASKRPPATSLALRRVGIDTYRENLAYMHRACLAWGTTASNSRSAVATARSTWPCLLGWWKAVRS